MNFLIADTFTDSLSRLTAEEQKGAKTTAFDLQVNPEQPGLSYHRLDKAKDKNFWSVRVNADIRIIVHRMASHLLLCYVDHHDKAYAWAERRKLETHPTTGAAQLVEIRETFKEVTVSVYRHEASQSSPQTFPFHDLKDEDLLSYGVPPDWIEDVRGADEDALLVLAERLPSEAAEALLEIATGGKPRIAQMVTAPTNAFEHPDAQRRFRLVNEPHELRVALEYPWEKWIVFLHPEQRQWVEGDYQGAARVSGTAGTGKTIVALHRAAHLARFNAGARVLLTTFSDPLANALEIRLRRLLAGEPRVLECIEVHSLHALALRLATALFGSAAIATREEIRELIRTASEKVPGHRFSQFFLLTEWEQVIDAWQLDTWEDYRDVARLGRKTRLPQAQREILWTIFERVREELKQRGKATEAGLFTRIASVLRSNHNSPYDYAVVDEAQDVSVSQLRFFAALGDERPNALFFAGDLGQRIFQEPFSWKSVGVDIRGRSRTLRVNYRTSHQIRQKADLLLGPEIADVDGNKEKRRDTVSTFNGPEPRAIAYESEDAEVHGVGSWIADRITSGAAPHEVGLFVRSERQIDRARAAADHAGVPYVVLDEHVRTASGSLSISTMHLAKGLEFRAVAVMACDDEVIPLQERIETVGDEADLQEVYDTERHLLYVACTRAREELLVSGVEPVSEFLDDLRTSF